MGNWLGKKVQGHPRAQPSPGIQVKVRMTRTQLKELMSRVDPSQGDAELGPLIMQERLEGRLPAPVIVPSGDGGEREKQLSTIVEET
ncbi:hypothetical protein ACJRO7_030861 [Eucalyptus globulus]|uniref:Uncharacterized protein n=1 Tax=Eucalyptus globulus TaxID=34317 RepID=A0ABD3JNP0_EUCGL